jgi:hypothetical protein
LGRKLGVRFPTLRPPSRLALVPHHPFSPCSLSLSHIVLDAHGHHRRHRRHRRRFRVGGFAPTSQTATTPCAQPSSACCCSPPRSLPRHSPTTAATPGAHRVHAVCVSESGSARSSAYWSSRLSVDRLSVDRLSVDLCRSLVSLSIFVDLSSLVSRLSSLVDLCRSSLVDLCRSLVSRLCRSSLVSRRLCLVSLSIVDRRRLQPQSAAHHTPLRRAAPSSRRSPSALCGPGAHPPRFAQLHRGRHAHTLD